MFKTWIQFYERLWGKPSSILDLETPRTFLSSRLYWNAVGKCGEKIKVEKTGKTSKSLLYSENPTGNKKTET